ncbi:MAG TPA: anti-sigma factor [Opitutaceae bacterium]|nr:anti-sigma factor [Opitutaceae bacterium]
MTADHESEPAPPAVPAGFLGWLPWAAAAVAAVLAGFLIEVYLAARMEIAILNDQSALTQVENQSLRQRLEAERILSARRIADLSADTRDWYDLSQSDLIALQPPAGGDGAAAAVVIWDAHRQQGTLLARRLPAAPAGREYRLWIVDPRQPDPIAAGGFAAGDADGATRLAFRADRTVTSLPGFVVTLETRGPATRPAGPVVLSGPPPAPPRGE